MFLFAIFFFFLPSLMLYIHWHQRQRSLFLRVYNTAAVVESSIVDEDVTLKNKVWATTVSGWDMSFCLARHRNTAREMSYFVVCTKLDWVATRKHVDNIAM